MTRTSVMLAAALIACAFAAEIVPTHENLVVHEWGTFTSVAGENGEAVEWAPFAEPSDLPCFVNRLTPLSPKASLASVRMETPVLYFYPQHEMNLSVHVSFPKGWITEWYPQATRVTPQPSRNPIYGPFQNGQIAWDELHVSPGANPQFPAGTGASRYYAARNTDSAPIEIGGQHEKMIFYRGVANFTIPLQATFDSQGSLDVRNTGADVVPMALLFENTDGRIGYRLARDLKAVTKIEPPELNANPEALRLSLTDALVENGLYPKEAAAMIETWRDSWFESGARLIYIVPRPMVDAVLPLSVSPEASSLSRVFVGRIEVLSTAVRQTIETAIATGDVATLGKFGRFLEPFVEQIRKSNPGMLASPAAEEFLGQARGKVWESLAGKCVE